MSEQLPQRYDIAAGTLSFLKGTYKGKSLVIWDAVSDCEGRFCPVFRKCPFEKKNEEGTFRCIVQLKYIKTMTRLVLKKHAEKMTEDQIYYFGTQVLPLASQLVKFKLVESSLGLSGMFVNPEKGNMYTHPVYKEIRQTIQALNQSCAFAAIDPRSLNVKRLKPGDLSPEDINDVYDIETDYYEKMSRSELEYKKAEGNANSNLSFNHEVSHCVKEDEDEDEDSPALGNNVNFGDEDE